MYNADSTVPDFAYSVRTTPGKVESTQHVRKENISPRRTDDLSVPVSNDRADARTVSMSNAGIIFDTTTDVGSDPKRRKNNTKHNKSTDCTSNSPKIENIFESDNELSNTLSSSLSNNFTCTLTTTQANKEIIDLVNDMNDNLKVAKQEIINISMKDENEKFNNSVQNNDNNSNNTEEKSYKNDKTNDSVTTITNIEMLEDHFLLKKKNKKDLSTSSEENSVDKSLFSTITKSSHSSNISFGSSKTKSTSSNSSSSVSNKRRKDKLLPSESKLCSQSFSMIKFLGTINTKKLELKSGPRVRRANFHDWIGCLEVAFSNYKYTRNILNDYSTTQKIHKVKSKAINRFVYSVCYAFMEKSVRLSTSSYKDNGVGLLKALHIKCAAVDSKAKERAKQAFLDCKIGKNETSISFFSRLERKANEARNFDIRISESRFIKTLLYNMRFHKHYSNIIASLLTTYELDPTAFDQKWIENKFYTLDEERVLYQRSKTYAPHHASFVSTDKEPQEKDKSGNFDLARCKYCYKLGHTDVVCRD